MFKLDNVKYKHILDIRKLEIPGNRITCIVGESGGGKTTLLRLLNKLISCDSGEISYKGRPLRSIPSVELRRQVVMLPQQPVIYPGTVRDNLLVGLKFAEKPAVDDARLRQVLSMVHLSKELSEQGEKLSGGEKQRLALGRVILLEPEVFLLDEPSSALDEGTERLIIERLAAHTKETNKTLVMVTHSRQIARDYAESIVVLNHGSIEIEGGNCE